MEHLISVIIPVYKVEEYLHRCVDSVLGQTYRNLEVILVDDGSPDNSGAICDQYARRDSRVKVIHQKNAGVSAARNAALAVATGDYLCFVDSDDYLPQDAIALMFGRMQQDESDMIIGRYVEVYEDESADTHPCRWMQDATFSGLEILGQMGNENRYPVGILAKMYRKDILEGITYPSLICGEDLFVFPLLLEKCKKVSVIAADVYCYYQRTASVMHVYNERAKRDHMEATLFMSQQMLKHGLIPAAVEWYAFGILTAFWLQDEKEAHRMLKKYFDGKAKRKLLFHLKLKTWVLWLGAYVPLLKKLVQWKVENNQHRREML